MPVFSIRGTFSIRRKGLVSGAPPFIFQDSKIEGTPRIVGELAFYLK